MSAALSAPLSVDTVADLLARLGDVPASRVRLSPPPGLATEQDVLRMYASSERRLCELVDGVLVEKAMGFRESVLAVELARLLGNFVKSGDLGLVAGPDAFMRIAAGTVRLPDVSFVAWDHVPGGRIPTEPVAKLAPDLAVEVLSTSNTRAEMARKRAEYFAAGTGLVWIVDPNARTVEVYTGLDRSTVVDQTGTLDGGDVLPGFRLQLRELFADLDRKSPPAT
jgi:Uma2 family endonuclease